MALTNASSLRQLVKSTGMFCVDLMEKRPLLGSAQLSHLIASKFGITQASASYRIGELIRFKVLEII